MTRNNHKNTTAWAMTRPAGQGRWTTGRRALMVVAALGLGALAGCSVTSEGDTEASGDVSDDESGAATDSDGTSSSEAADDSGDSTTESGADDGEATTDEGQTDDGETDDGDATNDDENSDDSNSDDAADEPNAGDDSVTDEATTDGDETEDGDQGATDEEADSETDGGEEGDEEADGSTDPGEEPTEPEPAPDPPRLPGLNLAFTTIANLDIPIAMTTRAGSDNLYIAQQNGEVRVIEAPGGESSDNGERLLDLRDDTVAQGEQGLLGIAFSPDGRRLYASYTDRDGSNRIDEFTMSESTRNERVDTDSRRNILTVEQPAGNHNGGDIHFGPDGFLYIGLGDGGGAGDPFVHGQNRASLLGTILRIDPDVALGEETGNPDDRAGARPYDIPADNPFVDDDGAADEIWISGARNPWRFAFDDATGDLWIADVGQSTLEEINHFAADDGGGRGANLGWSVMEGTQSFTGEPEPADHSPPVFEYGRNDGCSVTGGIVYRGEAIPALDGFYLFGDFCSERVRALRLSDGGQVAEVGDLNGLAVGAQTLISFGEGPNGDAYVLLASGEVRRIDLVAAAASDVV